MRRRVALKSAAPVLIALLACAGALRPTARVKAQTLTAQPACPPYCDWGSLLLPGTTNNGNSPTPPPRRATFRVTLDGFRVNHESDDDILEGDGRGDEIFITSYLFGVSYPRGVANPAASRFVGGVRTQVMGDARGHPQRVSAGAFGQGLRTGDEFPKRYPWIRDGAALLADRPPIILWQGKLVERQDMVLIAPFVWEWDSADYSASQRSVDREIRSWLGQAGSLKTGIDYPPAGNLQIIYRSDPIRLDGKAGTRPIGYEEGSDDGFSLTYDHIYPQALVLTYHTAMSAVQETHDGMKGVFEIRYADAHDHGDYSLYLQVEQVPDPLYRRETTPVRPRP